jgi:hypothetical protein
MRAEQDIAIIQHADLAEAASAVARPLELFTSRQANARPVIRSPKQLRLHKALEQVGWNGVKDEFTDAIRSKNTPAEPVLITASGIILAGFGRWRLAVFECRQEIQCIEYSLNEEESLQFILTYHQCRRGWNAFVRVRLALTQQPLLKQRALDNMRAGGKYKGWANLPEAQHFEVRQEIARAAGVGARNVSNVEKILELAHPRLLNALREGTLTINRAVEFCKLPRNEQLDRFISYSTERATNKIIRRSTKRSEGNHDTPEALIVLDALQRIEEQRPGSVEVRVGRQTRTVILIGQDLLRGPFSQHESIMT